MSLPAILLWSAKSRTVTLGRAGAGKRSSRGDVFDPAPGPNVVALCTGKDCGPDAIQPRGERNYHAVSACTRSRTQTVVPTWRRALASIDTRQSWAETRGRGC